jgi:hypothetical protein
MRHNRAPTPTLPRKRERERATSVSSLPHKRRERASLLSSLSRLRGRVARSSERDGWGHAWLEQDAQAA